MLSLLKRLFGRDRGAPRPKYRGSVNDTAYTRTPTSPSSKPSTVDIDTFDNPDLAVETPPDEGFDPYNTGTFNRSGSWERINKRRSG